MIVLITPTGARPAQFDICTQLMRQQTYTGEVMWVIVDDAYPVSTDKVTDDFREGWTIVKVHPQPRWSTGQNTQARNIAAGVQAMKERIGETAEAIFIIEDDDYYRPVYLERMMAHTGHDLWGEMKTIYYNVRHRRHITNANTIHASLFQTAFRPAALPQLMKSLPNKFIDSVLWATVPDRILFYEGDLAVGIKGMPGRGGIGAGHSRAMNMLPDFDMKWLKAKIGNDATLYERYYRDNGVQQHRLFNRTGTHQR